ncbi:MAG: hypothetical protein AAGC44_14100 [Planctomycetota bacterium]
MTDTTQASPITLTLDRDDAAYVPGEPITGTVAWDVPGDLDRVVLRLFWRTEGKGTQDVGVAEEVEFDLVSRRGSRGFSFSGLVEPYSFSGQLVSIVWAIEAIAKPSGDVVRRPLTFSPTGQEVRPA